MILWLILGASVTLSLVGLLVIAANPAYAAAVKNTKDVTMRPGASAVLSLTSLAMPGLWAWYSFSVDDWRFAGIFVSPLVAKWLYKLIRPKAAK
jgi:hypothetical protein